MKNILRDISSTIAMLLLVGFLGACSFGASVGSNPSVLEKMPEGYKTHVVGVPGLLSVAYTSFQILPGYAVSTGHLSLLQNIGHSKNYDMIFLEANRPAPKLSISLPKEGDRVIIFGSGIVGERQYTSGTITQVDVQICRWVPTSLCMEREQYERPERVFLVRIDPGLNVGPGFSGGPTVNEQTGEILGMLVMTTQGSQVVYGEANLSTIQAIVYPIDKILEELEKVKRGEKKEFDSADKYNHVR